MQFAALYELEYGEILLGVKFEEYLQGNRSNKADRKNKEVQENLHKEECRQDPDSAF